MPRTSVTARVARLHPWVSDGALAVVLAACGLLLTATASLSVQEMDGVVPPVWRIAVATAVVYAPLVVRRTHPVTALALVSAGHVLFYLWLVPEGIFASVALFLVLHSVGARADARWRTPARAASVAVVSVVLVVFMVTGLYEQQGMIRFTLLPSLTVIAMDVVFFAAAWRLGDAARERREREEELAQRNRELEAQREENARRAVLDERVRIARELHDVVAHSVSVMGVQAGAARRVLATDPSQAVGPLQAIEDTSRSAVAELQQLLGFLRQREEEDGVIAAPQPGVEDLPALVRQAEGAGLRVDLTVVGEPRPLPGGLSVSVYRVIQEALTNTLRHARAAKAEVLVTWTPDAVEVEVLDDGRGPVAGAAGPVAGGGLGLVGMHERAVLHGGSLDFGCRDGGGYRVALRLPTPHAVAA